jgi:hypothetical protein
MAEPSVTTRINPSVSSKIMIGASHHFLRTRKKLQNSLTIENFPFIPGIIFRRLPVSRLPFVAANDYFLSNQKQFQSRARAFPQPHCNKRLDRKTSGVDPSKPAAVGTDTMP